MKKIIAVFALFLAFSVSVTAQTKKKPISASEKQELLKKSEAGTTASTTTTAKSTAAKTVKSTTPTTTPAPVTGTTGLGESPVIIGRKYTAELNAFVKLDPAKTADLPRIFEMKYRTMLSAKTEAEKQRATMIVEKRLEAALTAEQLKKLRENTVLYDKLTK